MKKSYRIKRNEMQFNAKGFLYTAGMTYAAIDTDPETIAIFETLEEAKEDLVICSSIGHHAGGVVVVSEFYIESCEVDEDGEEIGEWNLEAVAPLDEEFCYAPDGDTANGCWFQDSFKAFDYAKDYISEEMEDEYEVLFLFQRKSANDDLEPVGSWTVGEIRDL